LHVTCWHAEDSQEQRKLDDAVDRVDLVYLEFALQGSRDQSRMHRVFHLQVNRTFKAMRYVFASEYVEKRVVAKFLRESKDKFIQFLKKVKRYPSSPSFLH
jgi:hypothetical protein